MTTDKICPVCHSRMRPLFRHLLLSKYEVDYFSCLTCGLIQTEDPYWLEEAYGNAISSLDTGILHRNIRTRRYLEPLIELLGLGRGCFADIGGGYGTLTRLMRDIGYDCSTHDPYCDNIFAKDFEVTPGRRYDAVFAFEVLEHVGDPIDFITQAFSTYKTKTLLFSTCTFESTPGVTWWYYSFDSGQHISFYQPRTLRHLAEMAGCRYYRVNESIHIITDRNLGFIANSIIKRTPLLVGFAALTRIRRFRKTKIFEDQEHAKAALKSIEGHPP